MAKQARTSQNREDIESSIGAQYTELIRLPYFDIVRCHAVDPMHNLFLGTAKNTVKLWKDNGIFSGSDFDNIQSQTDSITLPANIGRIPGKIAAGFSDFTAEQWKTWTTVLSPFVLHGLLSHEHYKLWCLFVDACVLLCRKNIRLVEVQQADDALVQFCKGFEQLYGKQKCTPNMHMHCHLKDCILDVGPLYSFWHFSFERYNGILEGMQKTWHAPERQLMHM